MVIEIPYHKSDFYYIDKVGIKKVSHTTCFSIVCAKAPATPEVCLHVVPSGCGHRCSMRIYWPLGWEENEPPVPIPSMGLEYLPTFG